MKYLNCPACGVLNDYDWPLDIGGVIEPGGCQDCWESKVDKKWWKAVIDIDKLLNEEEK